MKYFEFIKRKVAWNFFPQPRNIKIESMYEIGCFTIIIIFVIWVYSECNKVPYLEENLVVECLDNETTDGLSQYIKPHARIRYSIPNTSVEKIKVGDKYYMFDNDSSEYNLEVRFSSVYLVNGESESYSLLNKLADSLYMLPNRDSIIANPTIKYNYFKGNVVKENRKYRALFPEYYDKSLVASSQIYDSLCTSLNIREIQKSPAFYYTTKQTTHKSFKYYIMSWLTKAKQNCQGARWTCEYHAKDSIKNPHVYSSELSGDYLINHGYFSGSDCAEVHISDPEGWTIGEPNFFSLEDISQAYYKFNIQSSTIDSMSLRIYFAGACEFSRIHPEPDDIGLNSITFHNADKINTIRSSGLLFYVRFIELQNLQNVRLFLITSVLGGLLTTILIFFVLAIYKVFIMNKLKS